MAQTTGNATELIKSQIWSDELKTVLEDHLQAQQYVRTLEDFDGDTLNIPSIGQRTAKDYDENGEVEMSPYDTGNFQFTIDEYVSDGFYMTDKVKQDSYKAMELERRFVPDATLAVMKHFETKTFATVEAGVTANSNEAIDGYDHRVAGSNAGKLQLEDFAYAQYVLDKANLPLSGLTAIVDPVEANRIANTANIVNLSNNPKWEGIVADGVMNPTGMRFAFNVMGFDVYTSNYLPKVTDSALEDKDGTARDLSAGAHANLFFSSAEDTWVGQWRQMPSFEFYRNTTRKRDEYTMTGRYGVKLFRPENMVSIPSLSAL